MPARTEDQLERESDLAAALEAIQKRLALALSVSQMGIWEIDFVKGTVSWSPECYDLTRFEQFEGTLAAFEAAVHPEDRAGVLAAIARAVQDHDTFAAEFRFLRGDGAWRWFAKHGRAEYRDDGTPIRVFGTVQDLTDSKTTQDGLRASEERFRQLAESIQEVFWLTNVDKSEVVYVSPGYETIWGRPCESLSADPRRWTEAIHPDDRTRIEAALKRQASGSYDEEYRIVRPDGTVRWIRDRAFPVFDGDGHVIRIAGVAQDITEHRELETQLRHTQKMQSIGELAGGVAHDFNNVLTVIATVSELLDLALPPDHQARELVEEIRVAERRAASMTRQLLAFSRKEVIGPRTVSLDEAVQDTEKMLRRLLGEDIVLTSQLQAAGGHLRIDPGQLVQVLMNLAVNARDAMPLGGRMLIETAVLPATRIEPERLMLAVADTGHGMNDEVKARIFEPFFTTKALGDGTGMGLSVVHGIVRDIGGSIAVTSEPGVGSRFEITFPRVIGASTDTNDVSKPAPGRGTVLIVEDDPNLRRLVERALSVHGYNVISAATSAEGLAVVQSGRTLDLLLTDLVMPETDGRTLATEVAHIRQDLRVLYTSGYTDDVIARRGIQQSEVAFLPKPFSVSTLLKRVQEAMAS